MKIRHSILLFSMIAGLAFSGCGSSNSSGDSNSSASSSLDSSSSSSSVEAFSVSANAPLWAFTKDDVVLHADVTSTEAYSIVWTQVPTYTGEPIIVLDDNTSAEPTFSVPDINDSAVVKFDVVVTDINGTVKKEGIEIELYRDALIIDAGHDVEVVAEHTVSLHGSTNMTNPKTSMQVQWTQVSGDYNVTLSGAETLNPTFKAPLVASKTPLIFKLTVGTDFFEENATVTTTVLSNLVLPTTPKPTIVQTGSHVVAHSNILPPIFANPNIYTHQWTQVSGPTVTLATPTAPSTSFTVPKLPANSTPGSNQTSTPPVVLQHTVTATPIAGGNAVATTTVHTFHPTAPPKVNNSQTSTAGLSLLLSAPPSVNEGVGASILANMAGGDGNYAYTWTQTSGPTVTLNKTKPSAPTFRAPSVSKDETLEFKVVVKDTNGSSTTKSISLIVKDLQLSVTAGSDIYVKSGDTAHLHVSLSTRTIGPYGYEWKQRTGSPLSISGPNSANPSIVIPPNALNQAESFELEVTVTDGANNTATDRIVIKSTHVLSVNAGNDRVVNENTKVTLHGLDIGGRGTLSMNWKQTSGATKVKLNNSDTLNPSFTLPVLKSTKEEVLEFTLTLKDAKNVTVSDTVQVRVKPVLPQITINAPQSTPLGTQAPAVCQLKDANMSVTYNWSSDQVNVTFQSKTDLAPIVNVATNADASKPVNLTCSVKDQYNRVVKTSKSMVLTLTPTSAALSVAVPVPTSVREGTTLPLMAVFQNASGPSTHEWKIISGPAYFKNATPAHESTSINPTPTLYIDTFTPSNGAKSTIIQLSLTANNNGTDVSPSKPIFITVNDNPVTLTPVNDMTVVIGQQVKASTTVTGGQAPYAINWDFNSKIAAITGDKLDLDSTQLSVGSHDVNLTAIDTATPQEFTSNPFKITVKPVPQNLSQPADQTIKAGEAYTADSKITPVLKGVNFTFAITESTGAIKPTLTSTDTSTKIAFTAPKPKADTTYRFRLTATSGSIILTTNFHVTVQKKVTLASGFKARICSGPICGLIPDQEPIVTCPSNKRYPVSTLDIVDNGDGTFGQNITKTCETKQYCQNKWWEETSDRNECTDFNPLANQNHAFTCHFCCEKDDCNYDIKPADATLFHGI